MGGPESAERELRKLDNSAAAFSMTFEQLQSIKGPPPSLAGAEPEVVEFWRAVVQAVLERIEIGPPGPSRRFTAGRVRLVPRPESPGAAEPWPAWDVATMTQEEAAAVALAE